MSFGKEHKGKKKEQGVPVRAEAKKNSFTCCEELIPLLELTAELSRAPHYELQMDGDWQMIDALKMLAGSAGFCPRI